MNYQAHYDRLIERARKRRIYRGYREKHHVIPRCIGGGDEEENIVKLTAEEHFVAHQLLVKIYPDEPKMVFAVIIMSKQCGNNKVHGWIKRACSKARRGKKLSKKHRNRISAGLQGRVVSEETKELIAASKRGKPRPREMVERVAAKLRGQKHGPYSEEHCARVSAGKLGKKFTQAHKDALSVAARLRRDRGDSPSRQSNGSWRAS